MKRFAQSKDFSW